MSTPLSIELISEFSFDDIITSVDVICEGDGELLSLGKEKKVPFSFLVSFEYNLIIFQSMSCKKKNDHLISSCFLSCLFFLFCVDVIYGFVWILNRTVLGSRWVME